MRTVADKNYELLKSDPRHPSLHLKKIGELWSVRVGARHRALAVEVEGGMNWFWIGTHVDYDKSVPADPRQAPMRTGIRLRPNALPNASYRPLSFVPQNWHAPSAVK